MFPGFLAFEIFSSVFYYFFFGSFIGKVSFENGLISNMVQVYFQKFLINFEFAFLVLPVLIVCDDFESRNFEVLRTYRPSVSGYYAGNFLSGYFIIFLSLLELAFISEFFTFIGGYKITPGLLIDPFILTFVFLVPLLVPYALAMLVSNLVANKFLGLLLVIFLFFQFTEISVAISSSPKAFNPTWVNLLSAQFGAGQSFMIPYAILGKWMWITPYQHLPIVLQIHMLVYASLLFTSLSYLALVMRWYDTTIAETLRMNIAKLLRRGSL